MIQKNRKPIGFRFFMRFNRKLSLFSCLCGNVGSIGYRV